MSPLPRRRSRRGAPVVVFEDDFRFHESAPRETADRGAVFGDRCQFPAQTRRARSHRTLSLARPSTNLLDEVFGIIPGPHPSPNWSTTQIQRRRQLISAPTSGPFTVSCLLEQYG